MSERVTLRVDDSEPGFNFSLLGNGFSFGYRGKTIGLMFSARIGGTGITSGSLGCHLQPEHRKFADNVSVLTLSLMPAAIWVGAIISLNLVIGKRDEVIHAALDQHVAAQSADYQKRVISMLTGQPEPARPSATEQHLLGSNGTAWRKP